MRYHTRAFVKNNTKNGKFSIEGQSCFCSIAHRLQPLVLVTQCQGVGLFALCFNLIQFVSIVLLKKLSQGSLHIEQI